jgi:hypothetical protein
VADVSITIRRDNNTAISVQGQVEDSLLFPFTTQLANLLGEAANAPISSVSAASPSASA